MRGRILIASMIGAGMFASAASAQVRLNMPAPPAAAVPAQATTQAVESQPSVGEVALYRFAQVRRTPERTYSLPVHAESTSWGHWYGFPSWRFHCRPIICHEFFVPGPSRRFGGMSNVSIFAWR